MGKFLIILSLFIFLIGKRSFSQTSEGCLFLDGTLYKTSTWFIVYYWTDPYAPCTIGAGWSFESSAGTSTLRTRCSSWGGTYGNYNCPLDDYIWLLILPLGGCGYLYMRKRDLQLIAPC